MDVFGVASISPDASGILTEILIAIILPMHEPSFMLMKFVFIPLILIIIVSETLELAIYKTNNRLVVKTRCVLP
ncbi:MAG: hypothetical protein RL248_2240 [Pseudomonadota bacterium]|jgi:hypothetical protein